MDGPIQRQVLLLKLVHEMENRPTFGEVPDYHPDSDIAFWIARVRALMSRVGVVEGLNFSSAIGKGAKYWGEGINEAQMYIRDAIETLRLEFELFPEDNIGYVYEAGEVYKYLSDILGVIQAADEFVFIIDPFFDSALFSQLFSVNSDLRIRILCEKGATAVQRTAQKFSRETGLKPEVRKSSSIHDRLIIADEREVWLSGSSIKDGGKKATYLIPVTPEVAIRKIEIYNAMWNKSEKPS